jgi:hypothetical protein
MDTKGSTDTSAARVEPQPVEVAPSGPVIPPELDALIEEYHVETFHNRGFDAPLYNHFRAATNQLKVRLAAFLTNKE